MVITHFLNGMILQVKPAPQLPETIVHYVFQGPIFVHIHDCERKSSLLKVLNFLCSEAKVL